MDIKDIKFMPKIKKTKPKTVIVTGGVHGIGRAIADSFLKSGNNVAIIDILESEGKEMESENDHVYYINSDLTNNSTVPLVIDKVIDKFGNIDILINNAGFQYVSDLENFPDDMILKMINLMLISPILLSKYSLRNMVQNGWGRIINISSIHGLVASPYKTGYVVAKHGLIGLTRSIAIEYALKGITCNAIAPTYVKTSLVESQIKKQAEYNKIKESDVINKILMKDSPIKNLLRPEEVSSLVCYLCSDAASSINGVVIPIDYGYTAK